MLLILRNFDAYLSTCRVSTSVPSAPAAQNPAYCWTLQNVPNGHPAPWFQCSLRGVLKLVRNTAPCYETIVCFPALPWVVAFHAAATVVHCRRSRSLSSDGDLQISFARARL